MRSKPILLHRIVPAVTVVTRLVLGGMFLWSSLPKIRQPYDFLSAVYSYELVGPKLGMLVAMTLPWMELLVGICLVGGIFVSGALLAGAALGALFTFVLASALYRGLEISCGCFSSSGTGQIGYLTFLRAVAITLCSAAAYAGVLFLQSRQPAADTPDPVHVEGSPTAPATGEAGFLPVRE